MALAAGTRIGPYEIALPIGAGGMGEVYRATDTNLNRPVAIKVLPEAVAGDADRLARFHREAQLLAALNHPNIAQVHGLETSHGTAALVMELVEGPTLADRIAQGPIPVAEALAIAQQIALALEAAHEQGIVHRDLKPANVKVRPDGTVKVLDFGLAKVSETATVAAQANETRSPTVTTPALTHAGVILGTAAYMSQSIRLLDLARTSASDFLDTPASEHRAVFSPDGKWIAYASDESGRMEVYVRAYPPAPGVSRRVSLGGGDGPVWAPDGSTLYYRGAGNLMAVPITLTPGFSVGRPRTMFRFSGSFVPSGNTAAYDIHPDGTRFIMVTEDPERTPPVMQLHIVQGWFDELTRLVPVE